MLHNCLFFAENIDFFLQALEELHLSGERMFFQTFQTHSVCEALMEALLADNFAFLMSPFTLVCINQILERGQHLI